MYRMFQILTRRDVERRGLGKTIVASKRLTAVEIGETVRDLSGESILTERWNGWANSPRNNVVCGMEVTHVGKAVYIYNSHDIFANSNESFASSYPCDSVMCCEKLRWKEAHNSYESMKYSAIREDRFSGITRAPYRGRDTFVIKWLEQHDNYFHWTIECLPRLQALKLYRDARLIDFVVVGDGLKGFQLEGIEAVLGFIPEFLQYKRGCLVENNILVSSDFPGWRSSENINGIRSSLMKNTFHKNSTNLRSKKLRLFVVRGNNKNKRDLMINREAKDILKDNGFVFCDPGSLTVREQVRLFGSAEYVIGLHGAAMTNIIFMEKGSRIVEIIPSYYQDAPTAFLAAARGLEWKSLLIESDGNSGEVQLSLAM